MHRLKQLVLLLLKAWQCDMGYAGTGAKQTPGLLVLEQVGDTWLSTIIR